MLGVFALALLAGWLALWRAPRPPFSTQPRDGLEGHEGQEPRHRQLWQPLTQAPFRRLLAVFLCNGIASAIPAALMLFFAQPAAGLTATDCAVSGAVFRQWGPVHARLAARVVRRFGLERAWLAGMLLAVACFGWAAALQGGQLVALCRDLRAVGRGAGRRPGRARRAAGIVDRAPRRPGLKMMARIWAGGTWPPSSTWRWPPGPLPLLQWLGYLPNARIHGTATPGMDLCALRALKLMAAWLLHRLLIASQNTPRSDTMNTRRHVLLALLAGSAVLAGCRQPQVNDYAQQRPKLELDRYFNGRIRAHGIFQKRGGEVVRRFTVVMDCHWEGNRACWTRPSAIPTAAPSAASGAWPNSRMALHRPCR